MILFVPARCATPKFSDFCVSETSNCLSRFDRRLIACAVAQILRAGNATTPRLRIGCIVASRFPYTVVLRLRGAGLISRGFCPIDKSTILWDATQPECILLLAGGVNEISVCATGENQSGKRQPCKGN